MLSYMFLDQPVQRRCEALRLMADLVASWITNGKSLYLSIVTGPANCGLLSGEFHAAGCQPPGLQAMTHATALLSYKDSASLEVL